MRIRKRFVALLVLSVIGLVAFRTYHDALIQTIQTVALRMRSSPFGPLFMAGVIMVTSIPPFLGFTFFASLSGFIFGFPGGVLPAVIGAMVGAMICFGLIRHFHFDRFIKLSPSKQEKYQAIQEAIEEGGFGMLLLIRLCPIPWQFNNMILAMLPTLTPKRYIGTTMIAAWKVSLEVWFGSQLASLSDPDLPPCAHRVTLITMGVGVLILAGVAIWLHQLTMKRVNKSIPQVLVHRPPPQSTEQESQWLLQS